MLEIPCVCKGNIATSKNFVLSAVASTQRAAMERYVYLPEYYCYYYAAQGKYLVCIAYQLYWWVVWLVTHSVAPLARALRIRGAWLCVCVISDDIKTSHATSNAIKVLIEQAAWACDRCCWLLSPGKTPHMAHNKPQSFNPVFDYYKPHIPIYSLHTVCVYAARYIPFSVLLAQ